MSTILFQGGSPLHHDIIFLAQELFLGHYMNQHMMQISLKKEKRCYFIQICHRQKHSQKLNNRIKEFSVISR